MVHDKYDNDILKALQRIANSLDKIEKSISNDRIAPTFERPSPTINKKEVKYEIGL